MRTDPMFTLYEALIGDRVRAHTYGHTTLGYERDIAIMPTLYDYSRNFFKRYYRPENTVLFIAGDVTPANVIAARRDTLRRLAARLRAAAACRPSPSRRPSGASTSATTVRRCRCCWSAYKLPAFDPADRTRVAADLFADLAFGETSDAYRPARARRAGGRDARCQRSRINRDPGLLDISARVKDPAKIDYVLDVDRRDDRAVSAASSPTRAGSPICKTRLALRIRDGPADAGRGRARARAVRGAHGESTRARPRSTQPTTTITPADVQPRPIGICDQRAPHRRRAADTSMKLDPVVLLNVPADPTISLSVAVRRRLAERPARQGRARVPHGRNARRRGTEKRSLDEILEALYPLAARLRHARRRERTTLTGRMHRDNRRRLPRAVHRRVV